MRRRRKRFGERSEKLKKFSKGATNTQTGLSLKMTSKSISAILWTLVSVNVLTLVFGGLITWLGYAIPVR